MISVMKNRLKATCMPERGGGVVIDGCSRVIRSEVPLVASRPKQSNVVMIDQSNPTSISDSKTGILSRWIQTGTAVERKTPTYGRICASSGSPMLSPPVSFFKSPRDHPQLAACLPSGRLPPATQRGGAYASWWTCCQRKLLMSSCSWGA